jgi:hypothetical protein
MSPILGIWASAQQSAATSSFESIQTVTVGSGGAASISFTSIPSTYTHLQVRLMGRSADTSVANGVDNITMSFNSDTTYTNYRSHYLNGNGTSAIAGALQLSGFYAYTGDVANSYNSNTSIYGITVIDILDYVNTNKNKTVRSLNGVDRNGSGVVNFTSSLWINTNAISTITISFISGTISQYSSFALYGIK